MASLQGQEIKDTYQSLLKTDGNTVISSSLQAITDGQGNATSLALSTTQLYVSGTISNTNTVENEGWYLNDGGTSGSQYFLYNAANRSIYLYAWVGDYFSEITSSVASQFPPGNPIAFVHTELGLLTGSIESSYFYDGEGDPLTIIKLTSDPSNGTNDTYGGIYYPTSVYYDLSLYSVSFGTSNTTSYWGHAEGLQTTAIGQYSHAEGSSTIALNGFTHAEGDQTTAIGLGSHTEGYRTKALGFGRSHAEGGNTTAIGFSSHTEGSNTSAVGLASHAEGSSTKAIGQESHAEGVVTRAIGIHSHAEGQQTTTIGGASHAEGRQTTSIGLHSHTEGWGTISSGSWDGSSGIIQHAEGRWNIPDTTSLLIVGNGTEDNARRNAFSITTWGTNNFSSSLVTPFISQSLNYTNDAAAAAGGVPLGGFYRSGSVVMIRVV